MSSSQIPPATSGNKPTAAFTLVEVLTATVLFALVSGVVIWGLTLLEQRATANRLYTQAQTICQNQIDRVLTTGPYLPQANPAQTPPELLSNQAAQTVQISTAPGNPVSGTMRTTVTDPNPPLSYSGSDLKLKQAKVVVSWTFGGKPFAVEMNTMRAPDQ